MCRYISYVTVNYRAIHPFTTRRSSDLRVDPPRRARGGGGGGPGRVGRGGGGGPGRVGRDRLLALARAPAQTRGGDRRGGGFAQDRKSTRLNYSHSEIYYADLCLKKKIV